LLIFTIYLLEAGRFVNRLKARRVTDYRILDRGGGPDQPCVKDSLETHRCQFGRAPDLLAGDRGLASAASD
jgi:hypothetical protein